jgi:hypothetical protein
VRQNIPFAKSGIYLGIWKDTENDVAAQRPHRPAVPDLHHDVSGATRLEPGRLLQVLCADTSAAADVTFSSHCWVVRPYLRFIIVRRLISLRFADRWYS